MTQGARPLEGRDTRILQIDAEKAGDYIFHRQEESFRGDWDINLDRDSPDAANLLQAVHHLRKSDTPVAFPTETVYGLGADATKTAAVSNIFSVKNRPPDNPLIVHISSLTQLRKLLKPQINENRNLPRDANDPIPSIYHPLISRFWPGPLTIILPLPQPSPFAPLITGHLSTFGVRMPSSLLALALIRLADVPIAAPSANTSTKPSPTTAAHVFHDLREHIDLILDGGPCDIGVESTVVDGTVSPPAILRPGGISMEMLRKCPGWGDVAVGYEQSLQTVTPRAPGMKYKHYSPRARVLLVNGNINKDLILKHRGQDAQVGLLKTKLWTEGEFKGLEQVSEAHTPLDSNGSSPAFSGDLKNMDAEDGLLEPGYSNGTSHKMAQVKKYQITQGSPSSESHINIWMIHLGIEATMIAHRLFAALRTLDQISVDVIFVESVEEHQGDAAAAIMNRLRKAAEQQITP
ncbi:MAG: hypothetical protein LQ351_000790 [Letrouitia transgressa]|nr:MAG: hypothetical protein LQ351_000790 [Letrouitia transgressa]